MKLRCLAWILFSIVSSNLPLPACSSDEAQVTAATQEGACDANDDGSGECTNPELTSTDAGAFTVQEIEGSKLPIVIVDNLLDADLLQNLYEESLSVKENWKPLIQQHQYEFARVGLGDDNLFHPSTPTGSRPSGGFPGLGHTLTMSYNNALRERLQQLNLTSIFKTKPRYNWNRNSFFGNTCYHPDALSPMQAQPHVDREKVALSGAHHEPLQLAMVHYLSPDWTGHGGTAFYQETASNLTLMDHFACSVQAHEANKRYPRNTKHFFAAAGCHCERHVKQRFCTQLILPERGTAVGYTANHTQYRAVHHVPYQFNRAVIYPPLVLHAAFLEESDVAKLSCDPKQGRLTANIYLI